MKLLVACYRHLHAKEYTKNNIDDTQLTDCCNEASVSSGDFYLPLLLACHDGTDGCGDERTVAASVYLDFQPILPAAIPEDETG